MFMGMPGVIIQAENDGTRQSRVICDLIFESARSFLDFDRAWIFRIAGTAK
jgi:hypothetical protein